MSLCRNLIFGLLAVFLSMTLMTHAQQQYAGNVFLNGEYKSKAQQPGQTYSVNPAGNIFLEHAIISRQAAGFTGPTYLPPKEYLKCANGQQCVRQNQCQGGYFQQQLPKILNCEPETDVCCTYRPPPPPPPPPTTTAKPFIPCGPESDCVAPNDCHNGEIAAADYVRKQGAGRCYAPEVCCRMPSTTLTNDGYIFNLPDKTFPLPSNPTVPAERPTPSYRQPTQPPAPPAPQPKPNNEYLPPPRAPVYSEIASYPIYPSNKPPGPPAPPSPPSPFAPQLPSPPAPPAPRVPPAPPAPQPPSPPAPYAPPAPPAPQPPSPPAPYAPPAPPAPQPPQPPQPSYRPQPQPQPNYRPQPQPQPNYRPQPQPQPNYRPQPQPTSNYLPPVSENEIPRPKPYSPVPEQDRQPAPSNEFPVRGEAQLSPQIYPKRPIDQQNLGQPIPKHFSKCASALVCTDESYCNTIGVITDTPVNLTPMEAAFRVPLTDCLVEGSGAPGKCCRDSNYVDPWPVNLAGVCATKNRNTKPTGIKDIDANFAEIPWQAMILKDSSKSLLCGGAIIGDEFVLTTASCVNGVSVPDVRVKAGEWELGSTTEPLPFQLIGARSIDLHPEYNPSNGANDMAIIRLEKRLEFASHIQPICISDEDPKPSEQCVTTGWGKQALQIHEQGAIMHVTTASATARSDCGADGTSVCSATKFDSCEFDAGSALACGSGSSVRLKGVYSVENACGEGQVVRFSKPDVKWINTAFTNKNKPLLLQRRV